MRVTLPTFLTEYIPWAGYLTLSDFLVMAVSKLGRLHSNSCRERGGGGGKVKFLKACRDCDLKGRREGERSEET